jgi:hypothetical protein
MSRFLQSLAGSFVGKLLAVLVVAVLATFGFGPERWVIWLLDIPVSSVLIARFVLFVAAVITLGLLIASIIIARSNSRRSTPRKRKGFLRRVWQRFSITFKLLKRRIFRFWRVVGPGNYEVPREIAAIGRPYYPAYRESRIEFSNRFSDASPGTWDLLVLSDPTEIIHRLNVLLRWPVVAYAKNAESGATPFCWTSGIGHMHISRYHRYKKRIVLINEMEIRPKFLAAIPGRVYWQNYIYLESAALPWLSIRGEEHLSRGEYQEYAIYNGRTFNRSEYDDGGYMLRGKPVRFLHNPDIRSKRTVPSALLIVAAASPANRPQVDATIRGFIQSVIADKKQLQAFADFL